MKQRRTLTTAEVADCLGINPRSVARWCRLHGIHPVRRLRVGRSMVTAWPYRAIAEATRPSTVVDRERHAC